MNQIRTLISAQFTREERRLLLQSAVVGIVVWAVVYALKTAVHELSHFVFHWVEHSASRLFLLIPLLLGALIVAFLTKRGKELHYRDDDGHIHTLVDVEGDGAERAISLYFASEPSFEQTLMGEEGVDVRWKMPTLSLAARKFLATLATLGSGASGGLEASVTLIGESVSASLFKPRANVSDNSIWHRWWLSWNQDHLQTAQLSGVAAAVATVLGAPLTAAFFAVELMYRRRPVIEKLVYALVSALIAFFLTTIVSNGHTAIFEIDVQQRIPPPTTLNYYGLVVLVAVLVAISSIFFGILRVRVEKTFHQSQPDIVQRHLLGALLAGLLGLGIAYGVDLLAVRGILPDSAGAHGLQLALGSGEPIIMAALTGGVISWVALIGLGAKMLTTSITIGSGGSAGLLVPSLYFGTMIAASVAAFMGVPAMTLIVPAMAASLVAIANVPLAAVLFTVELFGASYLVPSLIALVVATILRHDNSVYRGTRKQHEAKQIMPGVGVERISVPVAWHGKTLADLSLRNEFELTVIGILHRDEVAGLLNPEVDLHVSPAHVLSEGDVLVVLGRDERLERLKSAVIDLDEPNEV